MSDPAGGLQELQATIAERRGVRERERRRSRRRRVLLWAGRILALAVVFVLGYVIGRAIEQTPKPGGTQTRVGPIEPSTLPPVTRTVTVTP